MHALLSLLMLLLLPQRFALADSRVAVSPDEISSAWNCDWLVIFMLGVSACFYHAGSRRSLKRGGRKMLVRGRRLLFVISLLIIAAALLSPLDALAVQLASAHMVQHVLLMSVAAPLFVLARPDVVLVRSVPPVGLRRLATAVSADPWLWQPTTVALLYGVSLWMWHWPPMYQAALRDSLVHDAQHLSFFVAACLFWRVVLIRSPANRASPLVVVLVMFLTAVHATLLAVFLTLSPQTWYVDYAPYTARWGLSPLSDQQLAGLIMWVPACLIYPAAAAVLFARWLGAQVPEPDQEERSA